MRLGHWIVVLLVLGIVTSCAQQPPKPFERGERIDTPRQFIECREEGRGC